MSHLGHAAGVRLRIVVAVRRDGATRPMLADVEQPPQCRTSPGLA